MSTKLDDQDVGRAAAGDRHTSTEESDVRFFVGRKPSGVPGLRQRTALQRQGITIEAWRRANGHTTTITKGGTFLPLGLDGPAVVVIEVDKKVNSMTVVGRVFPDGGIKRYDPFPIHPVNGMDHYYVAGREPQQIGAVAIQVMDDGRIRVKNFTTNEDGSPNLEELEFETFTNLKGIKSSRFMRAVGSIVGSMLGQHKSHSHSESKSEQQTWDHLPERATFIRDVGSFFACDCGMRNSLKGDSKRRYNAGEFVFMRCVRCNRYNMIAKSKSEVPTEVTPKSTSIKQQLEPVVVTPPVVLEPELSVEQQMKSLVRQRLRKRRKQLEDGTRCRKLPDLSPDTITEFQTNKVKENELVLEVKQEVQPKLRGTVTCPRCKEDMQLRGRLLERFERNQPVSPLCPSCSVTFPIR